MLKKKSNWPYELLESANQTATRKTTGETHFSMAYETEAVIPIQVTAMPNLYIEEHTTLENDKILKSDINFANEHSECDQVRLAAY